MATTTIDLTTLDDPRDGIHRAVQALVEGACVELPMEEGGVPCRLATLAERPDKPPATEDVAAKTVIAGSTLPTSLLVGSLDTSTDFLPELTPVQARVYLRAHPGSAVFQVGREVDGPLDEFPEWVQQTVATDKSLMLRVAGRAVPATVLSLLPAPVVAGPAVAGADVDFRLIDQQRPIGQPSIIAFANGRANLVQEHSIDRAELNRLAGVQIVLVCTGNTCRSPMAEAILKSMLARELNVAVSELSERGVSVLSAGVATGGGSPASPEAVRAIAQYGLDLSDHRSRPATLDLLQQSDAVFTMTQGHRATIVSQAPFLSEAVQALVPDGRDVDDPIGGPAAVYQACLNQIESALRSRLPDLLSLVREIQRTGEPG